MAIQRLEGLKGLKGLSGLSDDERQTFIQKQLSAGVLPKNYSLSDAERLYKNKQFIDRYGIDAFRGMTSPEERDLMYEHDILGEVLESYNPYITNKLYSGDKYLGSELKFSPDKGIGDEDGWKKLQTLYNNDIDSFKTLMESDWVPERELREALRGFDINTDNAVGPVKGIAEITKFVYGLGKDIYDSHKIDKNNAIFNDTFNRYLNSADVNTYAQQRELTQNILENTDRASLHDAHLSLIRDHIPAFAAHYNDDGSLKGDFWKDMEDFGDKEKAELLAKAEVLFNTLPYEYARQQLNNYAEAYIAKKRGWWEGAILDAKDFFNRGYAYLGGYATSAIQYERTFAGDGLVWMNDRGEIVDPVQVVRNIEMAQEGDESVYTGEDGKDTRVRAVKVSKNDLFYQGRWGDGSEVGPSILNKKTLTDAERFNIAPWNDEEIERARKVGYSDTQLVYAPGEQASTWTEIFKMGVYPLVDGLLMTATGGAAMTGKAAQALGAARGILGAASIGDAYGNGVYYENYENNMSVLEGKAMEEARSNLFSKFGDDYEKNKEFAAEVDSYVENRAKELSSKDSQLVFSSDGMGTSQAPHDMEYYRQIARQEVIDSYINNNMEEELYEVRDTDKYLNAMKEAHESASTAAVITAATDALKYGFVNLFGYRKFLYATKAERDLGALSNLQRHLGKGADGKLAVSNTPLQNQAWWKTSSGRKFMGKTALKQAWGGGWTNWTDEMQANAGRQMNLDRFSAYMNNEYDGEGETIAYNALSSYINGVAAAIPKEQTTNAFIVGAGGSVLSGMPNISSIVSVLRNRNTRREWGRMTFSEKLDKIISNGVLSEYAGMRNAERNLRNMVTTVNEIVDTHEEFKPIVNALTLKKAREEATSKEESALLSFLEAVNAIQAIEQFKAPDNKNATAFDMVANASEQIQQAKRNIEMLSKEEFTEEEAKEFLKDYYLQNPSEVSTLENDAAAMRQIVENAKTLKEALSRYKEADETLSGVEKERGNPINPLTRNTLIQRHIVDRFLEEEGKELEQLVSGMEHTLDNADPPTAVYGTSQAVDRRISSTNTTIKTYQTRLDEAKKKAEEAKKEVEKFEAANDVNKLSNEDRLDYLELQATQRSEEKQVSYIEGIISMLNANIAKLNAAKEKLKSKESVSEEEYGEVTEPDVLSKQQILNLDPVSRAEMLNPFNETNYSEEQKRVIRELRKELKAKDPTLLDKINRLAAITLQRQANRDAYVSILEDPEAAAVQMDQRLEAFNSSNNEALNLQRAFNFDTWLRESKVNPQYTLDQIKTSVKKVLRNFKPEFLDYLLNINYDEEGLGAIPEFRDDILNAKEWSEFDTIVARSIGEVKNTDGTPLDKTATEYLRQSIENITKDANSVGEAIAEITKAINAQGINAQDAEKLRQVLSLINNTELAKNAVTKNPPTQGPTTAPSTVNGSSAATVDTGNSNTAPEAQPSNTGQASTGEYEALTIPSKSPVEARREFNIPFTEYASAEHIQETLTNNLNAAVQYFNKEITPEQFLEKLGYAKIALNIGTGLFATKEEMEEFAAKAADRYKKYIKKKGETSSSAAENNAQQTEPPAQESTGEPLSPSLQEEIDRLREQGNNSAQPAALPKRDTTDQGNVLPVPSAEHLLGNTMYEFDTDALKLQGIVKRRTGRSPNDSMSQYFEWLRNEGVHLQDIIDNELGDIAELNPDIHLLYINPQKNTTNDAALGSFTMLAVEYTDQIRDKHDESRGGVVTAYNIDSEGKNYLIIGTLGADFSNAGQKQAFVSVHDKGKAARDKYFRGKESERFFVLPDMYTKIKDISAGRLVKAKEGETPINRRVSALVGGPANLSRLKWLIVRRAEDVTVNVSSRDAVHPPIRRDENAGGTFLLIKGANGEYIPAKIRQTALGELVQGSELQKRIESLLYEVTSPEYSERYRAIVNLGQLLYLGDDVNILIGSASNNTVSLVQGSGPSRTIIASINADGSPAGRASFVDAVERRNPLVNLTVSNLADVTTLKMFDEAGALITDISSTKTANVSYTVYAIDPNTGNPIITERSSHAPTRSTSDLERSARASGETVLHRGTTYRKDSSTGTWMKEPDRNNNSAEAVTNPYMIAQLEREGYIQRNGIPTQILPGRGNYRYYIINNNVNAAEVWYRDSLGDLQKLNPEQSKTILQDLAGMQQQQQAEQRAEEALEPESKQPQQETLQETSEEVLTEGVLLDLQLGEPLTEGVEIQLEDDVQPQETTENSETPAKSAAYSGKTIDELSNSSPMTTAEEILYSPEHIIEVLGILAEKGFTGETVDEALAFMESKNIPTIGINNIDEWKKLIRDCR